MITRGRSLKKKASLVKEGMYPNKPITDNPTHNSPSLLENPPRIELITRLPDLQVYWVGVLTNFAFGERVFTIFFPRWV